MGAAIEKEQAPNFVQDRGMCSKFVYVDHSLLSAIPNAEIRYVVRYTMIVQCFIGNQAQLIHDLLRYTQPM